MSCLASISSIEIAWTNGLTIITVLALFADPSIEEIDHHHHDHLVGFCSFDLMIDCLSIKGFLVEVGVVELG